ncbi:hypothetical protein [Dyadobacter sediminis]|uniref:Prevent-host-death protein n=1 Tax=Dyadobacter sediminis TaxID=1493691 RepID=A0A5R9KGL8_9BACT|nr:hypothetical protein [Dyadobacter sediminis]TLU95319.1 hypothetical protein FEM55_07255 [Dyadobacter sediminis]GGC16185.1 hypothetical protein GCM10011325_48710 [Dyadobacter sediminis]
MNIQFLANNQGKITAVQLPIKDWKELERKAEAYDLAASIRTGLKEVELIEKGEVKPKSLEDLLNEL